MKKNVKILCILVAILGLAGYSFGISGHPGDKVQEDSNTPKIEQLTLEQKYEIEKRDPNSLDIELFEEAKVALSEIVSEYNKRYKSQGLKFTTIKIEIECISSNVLGFDKGKEYIRDVVTTARVSSVSTGIHRDHPNILLLAMSFISGENMHTFIFNIDVETGNITIFHHNMQGKKVNERSS